MPGCLISPGILATDSLAKNFSLLVQPPRKKTFSSISSGICSGVEKKFGVPVVLEYT